MAEESTPFTRQPIRAVDTPVDEFTTITIYFSIGWSVFVAVQFLEQVFFPVLVVSVTFCTYIYSEWRSHSIVDKILTTSDFVNQRPPYPIPTTAALAGVAILSYIFNHFAFSSNTTFYATYSSSFLTTVVIFQIGACVKYLFLRFGIFNRHSVRRGILGLYCRALVILRTFVLFPLWRRYFCQPSCSYSFLLYLTIKIPETIWMFGEFISSVSDYRNAIYNAMRPVKEEDVDDNCPVCQDTPIEPIALPCNHIGCYECVCRWLALGHTCPECRERICGARLIDFSDGFIPISLLFYCF